MLKSKDSKHLIFLAFVISLIFMFQTVECRAMEINSTDDVMPSNLENVELNYNKNSEITPMGNTFDDIQNAIIFDAQDGDTIVLDKPLYVSTGNMIFLNKSVSIVGKEGMTPVLDAKGLSGILCIQEKGVNVLIKNCEFRNGKLHHGGAILIVGHDIEIRDCTFKYNEAEGGGAIYTDYDMDPSAIGGNNLKIVNCNFYDNSANLAAGAAGLYGNNTEVINCVFNSNRVYNKNRSPENVFGGAVQLGKTSTYTNSKCVNCSFINNSAISTVDGYESHGGAGCLREGVSYVDCIFVGNKADFGGALNYHSSGNVENCIFENNTALLTYGGALSCIMYTPTMNLHIKDSEFRGNVAPIGGACYLRGENIIFTNCILENNYASQNGGAIFIESSSTDIHNSVFNRNIANINGGALYIHANSVVIQNNKFNHNEAIPDAKKLNDGLGGAIYINSSEAEISSNSFKYNTARNGSAVYIDKFATRTVLNNNEMFENQAWVYKLPVYAPTSPVLYGDSVEIESVIYGGNNIANASNIAVSNAIYNNALTQTLIIDGVNPVIGATPSGELYQDDREFNTKILLTVTHQDGTVVYNDTMYSNVFGEVKTVLRNLKVGKYEVSATHFEDNYYKEIFNKTTFTVLPKADVKITKKNQDSQYNYKDYILWNLTIRNNGPNKATSILIKDMLPDGLIWISDNSGGKYDPNTGVLSLSELDIHETITLLIITQINKTGIIVNNVNVSATEYDYNSSNNHDFDSIVVENSADVAISQTVSQKNPNFDDVISWTISATNNGPDGATEVKVHDIFPEGLIWISDDGDGSYDHITGVWSLNNLNKGETKTLTISCRVNKTGRLINNVSITCREYDWNMTNNNASEFIDILKTADLEVIKAVNNSNPKYLDNIKWTITVINNGPDTATGVVLTESIPKGLAVLSHNGGADFNGNIWDIGSLNKGESRELIIYCIVNKTGDFVNVVNVTCNEYDPDNANNNDSVLVHVDSASDLEVIKTVDNKNPIFQDTVHWIIEVKNNGPDGASEVVVSDMLPNGLTYIRSTLSKGNYDVNKGIWKINFIAPFTSEFLDIYCKVNKTGLFINNVSVSANEYDYNTSNNNASEYIFVNKTIDLAIDIFANNSNPDYKEKVLWTIIVSNNGPDTATGVKVFNTIPEGLIWIDPKQTADFNNGVWNIGSLNAGETKSLELICVVNKTGIVNNFASVSGNELEINLDNNDDSEFITIRPAADLEVIKTSSKIEYFTDELIDYMINVINHGPNTAHNISLFDFLDEGMSFMSFNASKGNFSSDGSKWMLDELDCGQSATLTFKAIANKAGFAVNKVSVTCEEYDYNPFNDIAEVTVFVKQAIDKLKYGDFYPSNNPIKIAQAYNYVENLEKTGSSIAVLVVALTVLLSFGFNYFKKN